MHKIIIDDTIYDTEFTRKYEKRKAFTPKNQKQLKAFIPGLIKEIFVKKGQPVKKGDKLLILEAMKMYNEVTAQVDGKVKSVRVEPGDKVIKDQLLIDLD